MTRLLWRVVVEEDGQDIIEYGLLAGLFGAVGGAVFPVLADVIATAYGNAVSAANEASCLGPPGSISSC
jgi:Flp pilus assembly pilin Flp